MFAIANGFVVDASSSCSAAHPATIGVAKSPVKARAPDAAAGEFFLSCTLSDRHLRSSFDSSAQHLDIIGTSLGVLSRAVGLWILNRNTDGV